MIRRVVVLVAALCFAGIAAADPQLAKNKNCFACHGVDKRTVSPYPSYREVAARYAGDRAAVARLARKIREGGVGTWGNVPMPANPQVSAAEAEALARWILAMQ